MKKNYIAILIIAAFFLAIGGWVFHVSNLTNQHVDIEVVAEGCLGADQEIEHNFEDNDMKSDSFIEVFIKNTKNKELVLSFKSELRTSYHPFEVHQCGIYFNKLYGWDYKKFKPLPDYKMSFWKYDYSGKGEELIDLTATGYGPDFRVSPNEAYVVLEHSYLGQEDYALVIKNLESMEDMLVVSLRDVYQQNNIGGTFRFLVWTDDNQHFWSKITQGAQVYGWVRVDTTDWSYEVFEAPETVLGGYPLDINTGWVPVTSGGYWTGSDDDDVIREERLQQGVTTGSLYLYNVITKERQLVHTESDPVWTGWPLKWLDNQTLEYVLPDGTTTTFTLPI